MSRAVNLGMAEADVRARCEASGVAISAIEPLPDGGTHLVCMTREGADAIRLQLSDCVITGIIKRFPFYRGRGPW